MYQLHGAQESMHASAHKLQDRIVDFFRKACSIEGYRVIMGNPKRLVLVKLVA